MKVQLVENRPDFDVRAGPPALWPGLARSLVTRGWPPGHMCGPGLRSVAGFAGCGGRFTGLLPAHAYSHPAGGCGDRKGSHAQSTRAPVLLRAICAHERAVPARIGSTDDT